MRRLMHGACQFTRTSERETSANLKPLIYRCFVQHDRRRSVVRSTVLGCAGVFGPACYAAHGGVLRSDGNRQKGTPGATIRPNVRQRTVGIAQVARAPAGRALLRSNVRQQLAYIERAENVRADGTD